MDDQEVSSRLDKALQLAIASLPEDTYLGDGEEFATVFNDAGLIVKHDGPGLDVKFVVGEPYRVDFSIGLDAEKEPAPTAIGTSSTK